MPELKLELKSIDEPAAASGAADVTAEEADDCDDLVSDLDLNSINSFD